MHTFNPFETFSLLNTAFSFLVLIKYLLINISSHVRNSNGVHVF